MKNKKNNTDSNAKKVLAWIPYILIPILIISGVSLYARQQKNEKLEYYQVVQYFDEKKVTEYNLNMSSGALEFKLKGDDKTYNFTVPSVGMFQEDIHNGVIAYNREHPDTPIKAQYQTGSTGAILLNIVPTLLMLVILGAILFYMFRKMNNAMNNENNRTLSFGKARVKRAKDESRKTTFDDVAGADEEKEELKEVVEFMRAPKRFTEMGARIPKGVLLVGPPGTGKTLLAKAVAGEAKVPFFSISGSDFVEMFVGVGASRVRDLFKQAIAAAPCIIFIDEIDAIGKSRDSQFGGNDEREQTLNQLLSEMDGFDSSKGVLILAATNRPEVLDKALLRPGRFDRRIIVDKPDLKGRLDTLKVHSKDVLMDESVDLEAIALATAGAVGSDLANIINEAAINAVKHHRRAVNQEDLFESVEVVIAGKEKKDRILGKEEKKMVAYHEVGHALVTALTKDAEPVQKITIVPRTMGSLGYTMQVPEEEKYLYKKEELEAKILTLLGGRAAEEIIFGTMTTGASNDIERATKLARTMISQYGMSDRLGIAGFEAIENKYLDGKTTLNCSDKTAAVIDEEVIKMLKESYIKTKGMLQNNLECLHKVSEYLLEKESITGKEFMEIVNSVKNKNEESDNND